MSFRRRPESSPTLYLSCLGVPVATPLAPDQVRGDRRATGVTGRAGMKKNACNTNPMRHLVALLHILPGGQTAKRRSCKPKPTGEAAKPGGMTAQSEAIWESRHAGRHGGENNMSKDAVEGDVHRAQSSTAGADRMSATRKNQQQKTPRPKAEEFESPSETMIRRRLPSRCICTRRCSPRGTSTRRYPP
jgi:hypothetical protein